MIQRKPAIFAGILLLAPAAGCGWTDRDEFIYSRQFTVMPRQGDGSRIASQWDQDRSRTTAVVPQHLAGVGED